MAGNYTYNEEYDRAWQPYDVPDHGSSPPPPPPVHQIYPGAHPSSSYSQMQSQRQYGGPPSPSRGSPPRSILTQGHQARGAPSPYQSPQSPAPRYPGQRPAYQSHDAPVSPEGDHLGPMAVGGGIAGVAYGVADHAPRDSGINALRDIDNLYRGPPGHNGQDEPVSRSGTPYEDAWETPFNGGPQRIPIQSQDSSSSFAPLANAGHTPGQATPRSFQSNASLRGPDGPPPGSRQHNGYGTPTRGMYMPPAAVYPQGGYYQGPPGPVPPRHSWYDENPYSSHSISRPLAVGEIDPRNILDDNDEGLEYISQNPKRHSLLSLGRGHGSRSSLPLAAGAVAVGAAAGAAGAAAASQHAGGLFSASRDASGSYAPVHNGAVSGAGVGGAGGAGGAGGSFDNFAGEKGGDSEWLASQSKGKSRMKRWIIGLGILILLAAIAGGVVGGILGTRGSSDSSSSSSSSSHSSKDGAQGGGHSGQTAAQDDGSGLLDKNSPEIKGLLNNPKLHKVLPGVDYTPLNCQYPDCLNPAGRPSQNNVTRDMAILSQLTNTVRSYGTDCQQNELILTAIDKLGLTDMKLWLGIYINSNATTSARQLAQAWTILEKYDSSSFAGVVVGNEVLFRQDLTATELEELVREFKQNLTAKNIDLPVATADLGSSWTTTLASAVDVVMANVHPFFAGVTVDVAAGWTYEFFKTNDVAVAGPQQKAIISEVGWPSGGGEDCTTDASGVALKCAAGQKGALAGIPQQNQFMADFICSSLKNGTDFFWFEAFDEPWKEQFNRPGAEWETQWGLMDVDRNLKDGLEIPDCGGQTVSRR